MNVRTITQLAYGTARLYTLTPYDYEIIFYNNPNEIQIHRYDPLSGY